MLCHDFFVCGLELAACSAACCAVGSLTTTAPRSSQLTRFFLRASSLGTREPGTPEASDTSSGGDTALVGLACFSADLRGESDRGGGSCRTSSWSVEAANLADRAGLSEGSLEATTLTLDFVFGEGVAPFALLEDLAVLVTLDGWVVLLSGVAEGNSTIDSAETELPVVSAAANPGPFEVAG